MDSPICLIENVDGVLRPVEEAINHLMKIRQRVVVVAVVGLYRTGKSYLMNKLAGRKDGFALGSTIQSKTKGIWMWCVPHPKLADHTLVLLDTEGLGDVKKGDSKNDAWIFSLAILLSSTLVYNSRGTIDNQAVENLQYVTELSERIKVKSSSEEEGGDAQFVQFFPNFVWAVRDFTQELITDGKAVTADEYLENSLELKKGSKTDKKIFTYNLPRECIRNYFPSRKCFVFPSPACPENMSRLESLDDKELYKGFRETTDTFCNYIFQISHVKTVRGGTAVTGRTFGHLVNIYVEAITQGQVPCLEKAVLAMAQIENQAAVDEGLKVYQSSIEPLETRFPVDLDQMSEQHQCAYQQATQEFMNRSFKDKNWDFLTKLTTAIIKHYSKLLTQNGEASVNKCQDLLKELSTPVAQKIQNEVFFKPGGYLLYCDLQDNLVKEYRATPNKGIRAEEVLEQFLKEKSAESYAILRADQKLTESEKKIHEEKERAALLEQGKRALEKKYEEIQRKMEDYCRSQEEKMMKMEEKMKQEFKQKHEEFKRALDRKLKEQKDLLEKELKEKVDAMEKRINCLEKKVKRLEDRCCVIF